MLITTAILNYYATNRKLIQINFLIRYKKYLGKKVTKW